MAGACQLTCFQGFGNCNDDPSDGCETDLANSWEHCSGCSSACDLPNVETQRCDGRCVVTTCSPGYADCNDNPSDGCEAALESDPRHCGWCGHSCGSSSCDAGVCSAQAFDSGFRFSGERTQLVHYKDSYWAMLRVESEVGLWRNDLDGWDANWLSFASEDIFFTLAGNNDRMYWADSDGDIFRADAEHPDGWVIAERPDAITMLSVADDRLVWVEGANQIQLAEADAQILDTVGAVATDVLAYPNGYYYATDTTVYRRTTVTTEVGDCLAETMLAYDPAGALVYWTGDSRSDPGTLRNDVSPDDAVPLPSSGILDLVVHDSYTYWTTTDGDLYRTVPIGADAEVQLVADNWGGAQSGPVAVNGWLYWICGNDNLCRTPIP